METTGVKLGDRAADRVAKTVGSWKFILIQSGIVILWVTVNSLAYTRKIHLDPFPFVFLNLLFSTQASFAAPVLQMSNNRKAVTDKEHNDRVLGSMLSLMQTTHALVEVIKQDLEENTDLLEEHLEDNDDEKES